MEDLDAETLSRITAHVLESIWAHLEEQGLDGFPSRVGEEAHDSDKLTGARIADLEQKVAGLDGASAGGGDLAQRVEALERRVAELAKAPAKGGGAPDTAKLSSKIDDLLEEKVDDLNLEHLRDRLLASVRSRLGVEDAPQAAPDLSALKAELKAELAQAQPAPDLDALKDELLAELGGAQAVPDLDALKAALKAELKAELSAELEGAAPAPTPTAATVSGGGAPSREELLEILDLEKIARRLEHMAIHPVLKAIDQRMKSANLDTVAEEAAEKAISRRFSSDALESHVSSVGTVDGLDDKLRELEERLEAKFEHAAGAPGGMLEDEAGKPIKLTEDRHFLALAREVKTLRDSLNLVEMFNSREFKEIFDRRVNQVISYLRNDAIPSAVKKALQQA